MSGGERDDYNDEKGGILGPEFATRLEATNASDLSWLLPISLSLQEQNAQLAYQLPKEKLDFFLDQIDQFSRFEWNWDSYDSPPFDRIVIERAKELVTKLLQHGIPGPNLIPTSSGSILLDWRTKEVHLEIDIDPEEDDVLYISGEHIADEIEYIGPLNEISNSHRRALNQVLCRLKYTS